jgi:hypothetical protein
LIGPSPEGETLDLARISSAGSYTKKRALSSLPPSPEDAQWRDMLPELLRELARPEADGKPDKALENTTHHQPEPAMDTGSALLSLAQREARDRIARRLKTVRKALTTTESKIPTAQVLGFPSLV